jgi:hypothetical protein
MRRWPFLAAVGKVASDGAELFGDGEGSHAARNLSTLNEAPLRGIY